ncbi:MAG: esterase/lipase family protein, partial [Planctomycetota bacterium]
MASTDLTQGRRRPGFAEHAISALQSWIGDHLSETGNGLHEPLAFFQGNRPVAPEDLAAPATGKVCVLVHGLGCNESVWRFPAGHKGGGYGELLEQRLGYAPLYVRYNTGVRISDSGRQLSRLLERYCVHYGAAVTELLLIGHSQGGLVIRSACHTEGGAGCKAEWTGRVRHVFYLGSPHLG